MNKTIITLLMLTTLSQLNAEHNRSIELNKLSYDVYMKKYQVLNKIQKQHIDNKLAQIDRIYQRALDHNITQTKRYKETLYKAERSIAMNLYLSSEKAKIVVTDEEIEAYYQRYIRDYTRVHAYTIVTKKEADLMPVYKTLQKSNKTLETFKTLAKKYSIHPRGQKGGDLEFIAYGTMVQPFGKVAFSLKDGHYNKKPFKTTLGWHIVYIEGKRIIPLGKVKEKIAYTLRMQKYRVWFKKQ